MGGGVSASLWSASEQEENKWAEGVQKVILDFVTKEIYPGIPIHSIKKSHDPKAPLWVEPLPEVLEKSLQDGGSVLNEMIMSVPTGVRIDGVGNAKIMFTLNDISYSLPVETILSHLGSPLLTQLLARFEAQRLLAAKDKSVKSGPNSGKTTTVTSTAAAAGSTASEKTASAPPPPPRSDPLPEPGPPVVKATTRRTICLSWSEKGVLPKPAGIVQNVEVQYAAMPVGLYDESHFATQESSRAQRHRHSAAYSDTGSGAATTREGQQRTRSRSDVHKSAGAIATLTNEHTQSQQSAIHTSRSCEFRGAYVAEGKNGVEKGYDDDDGDGDVESNDDDENKVEEENYRWLALVSKAYFQTAFLSYEWVGLRPGCYFRFRLRYRTNAGWSDWSRISPVYRTLPDRPLAPNPPYCSAITSNAIELQWDSYTHARENGSKVTEYLLLGRGAGHDEFTELYRGARTSYLALGLFPEFAYSFKVAAFNAVGRSDFSSLVSAQTPPKQRSQHSQAEVRQVFREQGESSLVALAAVSGLEMEQIEAAHRCSDAWREYWDPQSEQVFYFNTILATRQLVVPEVLLLGQESGGMDATVGVGAGAGGDGGVGDGSRRVHGTGACPVGEGGVGVGAGAGGPKTAEQRAALREKQFRKKRYRLLHALRKYARSAAAKRAAPGSPAGSRDSSPSTARNSTVGGRVSGRGSPARGGRGAGSMPAPLSPLNSAAQNSGGGDGDGGNGGLSDAVEGSQRLGFYDPVPYSAEVDTEAAAVANADLGANIASVPAFASTTVETTLPREGINLTMHRESMLADCFKCFSPLSSAELRLRRIWVKFIGEDGIDSGGPSKEAFLLLSKQAGVYAGPVYRKWLRYVVGTFQEEEEDHDHGHDNGGRGSGSGGVNDNNSTGKSRSDETTVAVASSGKDGGNSTITRTHTNTPAATAAQEYLSIEGFFFQSNNLTAEAQPSVAPSNVPDCTTPGSTTEGDDGSNKYKNKNKSISHNDSGTASTNNNNSISNDGSSAQQKQVAQLQEIVKSIFELDAKLHVQPAEFFYFLGRLLGKALYERQLVDFPLSTLLLSHMLGGFEHSLGGGGGGGGGGPAAARGGSRASSSSPLRGFKATAVTTTAAARTSKSKEDSQRENTAGISELEKKAALLRMLEDIKHCEPDVYTSLSWMLKNDITNVIYETFSVMDGSVELPLCARGEETDVTESNKLEYIRLMIVYKTTYAVSDSLKPFLSGFHEMVPLDIMQDVGINIRELNLILNGKREVDVEEIRAFCVYQGDDVFFNENHDSVEWLWRAVREFTDAERRQLLKFFTGSSRVPLDGYDPPLNVTQGSDMPLNSLPRAHTCFNQLVLPRYASYDVFVDKLKFAIQNTVGFALA